MNPVVDLRQLTLHGPPELSLFCRLETMGFWQVQLLTSLMLFVSNALPNVAGMGSVETAFLLVYSSFLPDASSMSLLMFYRLARR